MNYEYELKKLNRDKQISENIINSYKENLISKLPPREDLIKSVDGDEKKKNILSTLLSIFS